PARGPDVIEHGASIVLASVDGAFARQLADTLRDSGLDVTVTSDVTGVELAGTATNVAVLAAGAAWGAGPNVAGAAAGKVFAEVDALAQTRGGRPETFAGLAGAGDLVGAVVSKSSHNRRAGELLAQGVPAADIGRSIAQAADAVDSVELLASVAHDAHISTPALDDLAALVQGRIDPGQWTAAVTEPARPRRSQPVRVA
ncbi:MAG: NAD(P)H-dependent glycerol-3-phosphate dehydrogenase, partial [Solirubrobacteraceae bacterium]